MKQHYSLNDVEYEKLIKKVSMLQLIELVPVFSPTSSPVSKVSLMLIADRFGNFLENESQPACIVATAVWNCMDADEKVELMNYMNYEQDEDDEFN